MIRALLILLVLLFFVRDNTLAQDFFKPSDNYNANRMQGTVITEAVVSTAVTIGLNYLWYRHFKRSSFHFFNDNSEWLMMDKGGHAFSAYNITSIQNDIMEWCGVKPQAASLIGCATAFGWMTMIELFDGYSSQWGFSKGDMLANLSGIALYEGQSLLWNQQRVTLKFSYHASIFPQYYPQELGSNWQERLIKDYNGQSYWLSANISSFLPAKDNFPSWLNVAVGYGAEGMVGAKDNPKEIDGKAVPDFTRYRKFFFSFDTDLYRINYLSYDYKTILKLNRILKMPAPALVWNSKGSVKLYPFYY